MFTRGIVMVFVGIGGIIITILLGINFFNSSKKRVKELKVNEERDQKTFNNIAKNLGSYNSIQDISEKESIELLNKKPTEFLNENDSVVLDEESKILLNDECTEILKEKVEATELLQNSEDLTGILKDR